MAQTPTSGAQKTLVDAASISLDATVGPALRRTWTWRPAIVLLLDETAEKVDFAGADSIDANSRRPHGPSDGLGEGAEGNLLPRNAAPKST